MGGHHRQALDYTASRAAGAAGVDARRRSRHAALVVALDVQILLGLLLYFVLSPFTRQAMSDFGAAMKSPGCASSPSSTSSGW